LAGAPAALPTAAADAFFLLALADDPSTPELLLLLLLALAGKGSGG